MYKTILVPIDMAHVAEGKEEMKIVLEHASEDARIVLLYVAEVIPTWAAVDFPVELLEKSMQHSREELQAIADASGRKMEVDIRNGHSHNTILEVAKEIDADLIILASHRPGLKDYFLGSTASRVVRHANCSVLVVR